MRRRGGVRTRRARMTRSKDEEGEEQGDGGGGGRDAKLAGRRRDEGGEGQAAHMDGCFGPAYRQRSND